MRNIFGERRINVIIKAHKINKKMGLSLKKKFCQKCGRVIKERGNSLLCVDCRMEIYNQQKKCKKQISC